MPSIPWSFRARGLQRPANAFAVAWKIMSSLCHVLLLGLFSAFILIAQTPPAAPRVEHREVRHGATILDDYFWLRQKSDPKVVQYLEAENTYTSAMTKDLQPFTDALYKEMLARIKQTDLSVPTARGG